MSAENLQLPLVDLRQLHDQIRPEIDEAIGRVIDSSAFVLGAEVAAFETEFAHYCGTTEAVACANGTDALELVLKALGVGAGDEVITVSHTFAATAEAILAVGAVPRYVDVDSDVLLMDVGQVEAAINPRTKAIVPVHLYGSCVDMVELNRVAGGHGIAVVEDAAQAHGARGRGGARAGASGIAGCFSFYPGKNLGALGDAGAIVTSDSTLAARLRQARDHGRSAKYEHQFPGRNSRMDGIQGAVLRVKLRHLDQWNAARRWVAGLYREELADSGVSIVAVPPGSEPVYHLMVVRTPRREQVAEQLAAEGVATGIHYPIPVHRQPAFKDRAAGQVALPITEEAAGQVLSLPMFPGMTEADVARVASGIRRALSLEITPTSS